MRFPRFFDRQELKGVPAYIGEITDIESKNIQQMVKRGKLVEIRHLKRLIKPSWKISTNENSIAFSSFTH